MVLSDINMTTMYMGPGDNMSRLEYDNTALVEELRQCQADKDFVWSLWKKLQVANPNVTQAISLVVQREKEKAEVKDRKVLEILQMKDEKIEELQNILSNRTKELGDLAIRRVDTTEDFSRLHIELDRLRDKNTSLESQLKSFQNREKSLDDLHKSTVINAEQDRHDQQKMIDKLKMELEMAKSEKAENISQRLTLENKAMILERDVTEKMKKFESMIGEFEEAKRLLQQYQERTEKMHREIDYKNQELENVRKELSELWSSHNQLSEHSSQQADLIRQLQSLQQDTQKTLLVECTLRMLNSHNQLSEHSSQQADLIRQLQSLQQDTQKMLKNTEDAYSNEAYSLQTLYTELTSRYETLQKTETDLRRQVNSLRSEMLDKNNTISTLQSKVDSHRRKRRSDMGVLGGSFISDDKEDVEPVIDLEFKVKSLQREISLLRDTLHEKDSVIEQLEKRKDPLDLEFDVSRLNRRERSHSTPARELRSVALSPMTASRHTRTSSVSPVRSNKDTKYQLVMSERKVEDLKNTLRLRNRELEELKKAHAKRLERLKSSLNNYKLIKEQLKTLEEENSTKKKKKLRRSDPKKLQREDSDAVWNELAYFKNENRNLVVERMSLEEDVDALRVKASQDAATIHEIKVALQQEQEDREFEKRKTDMKTQATSDIQSELTLLKSEVQNKNFKLDRMEKDLREATADRTNLQEEKRILKAEVFELKQESAQHRIEKANYNRDINRLQRDLEEERANKLQQHIDSDKDMSPSPKPGHRSSRPYPNKPALRIRRKDNKTRSQAAKKYQRALNKSIEKMRNVFDNFDEDGWEEISSIEEEETEETESDTLGQTIVSRSRSQISQSDGTDTTPTIQRKIRIRPQNRSATRQRCVRNLPQSRSTTSQKFSTDSQPLTSSSGEQLRNVVLRETGTSPIQSPKKEKPSPTRAMDQRLAAAHNQAIRQLKPMKQRVSYLQQQVTTLRESRAKALKALADQKEACQQVESDLNLANQRLRMNKQNIQKLSSDIEKLQKEKIDMEALLSAKETIQVAVTPAVEKHTEQDWKILETRLKSSSNEICRQSAALRQQKQDNDSLQEQVKNQQDRINRLERDNNQKRTLLEEQRSKLRQANENSKSEANAVEELETKIKLLQDGTDKTKLQNESLKKRLSVVTGEKREYEERFLKINADLEKKTKQLMDCQNKKMELETSVTELERTAQQQMRSLAHHSEQAIEAAQDKLKLTYNQLQQYQQFIKSLAQELTRKTAQTRTALKEQVNEKQKDLSQSQVNSSLQRAQDLAKNILNLSQSDLDEIMSADGDLDKHADTSGENDKRRDKKWIKKCERLISTKDDFMLPLLEHFVSKIEERCDLLAKLYSPSSVT